MNTTYTVHDCPKIRECINDASIRGVYHEEFGTAFYSIFTNYGDSEYFWTSNEEYTNPILFCPGCGLDLRILLEKEDKTMS